MIQASAFDVVALEYLKKEKVKGALEVKSQKIFSLFHKCFLLEIQNKLV